MKVKVLAIGKKMPTWVDTGFQEYTKRLNQFCDFELVAIDSKYNRKTLSTTAIKAREADLLKKHFSANAFTIALDPYGKHFSTEQLAEKITDWQALGKPIQLLIGGPEGLDAHLLKNCQASWSLSSLTFPHPLVRVILAEQIYRAFSVINNHPYHRA